MSQEVKYKMVVVAKGDIPSNQSLEGDSMVFCGLCALKAIQSELMNPNVVKVVVHTIERMTEEEAEKRKVFFYYDNRCMEYGCDRPADFIITVWL